MRSRLTRCTTAGCKCCGHEGGRKNAIKKHGKEGCAECGTAGPDGGGGCIPIEARPASGGGGGGGGGRQQAACGCEFHCTSDERLLNRVVRRAVATNGFLESCRCGGPTAQGRVGCASRLKSAWRGAQNDAAGCRQAGSGDCQRKAAHQGWSC
jgi:hypothetical protein